MAIQELIIAQTDQIGESINYSPISVAKTTINYLIAVKYLIGFYATGPFSIIEFVKKGGYVSAIMF